MASEDKINKAESRAAHKAIEVFLKTLLRELEVIGVRNVVEVLRRTKHEHSAFFTDGAGVTGLVRSTYEFTSSPLAIGMGLETWRAKDPRGASRAAPGTPERLAELLREHQVLEDCDEVLAHEGETTRHLFLADVRTLRENVAALLKKYPE